MEQAGNRTGILDTKKNKMENNGCSQTQGVRNQCTHWWGNLGRPPAWPRVSERRGLGNRPRGVFCASRRHIPISHGYLYSGPNWKVGLWTICMHMHMHTHSCSFCLPLEVWLSGKQRCSAAFWPLDQKGQTWCVCALENSPWAQICTYGRNDLVKGWIQWLLCHMAHDIWILPSLHLQESCLLGQRLYHLYNIWNWAISLTNIEHVGDR